MFDFHQMFLILNTSSGTFFLIYQTLLECSIPFVIMAIISPEWHDGGVSYCSDETRWGFRILNDPINCSQMFQGSGYDETYSGFRVRMI
jgi:hypothetical protein